MDISVLHARCRVGVSCTLPSRLTDGEPVIHLRESSCLRPRPLDKVQELRHQPRLEVVQLLHANRQHLMRQVTGRCARRRCDLVDET